MMGEPRVSLGTCQCNPICVLDVTSESVSTSVGLTGLNAKRVVSASDNAESPLPSEVVTLTLTEIVEPSCKLRGLSCKVETSMSHVSNNGVVSMH